MRFEIGIPVVSQVCLPLAMLQCNGKDVSWSHIVKLYERDSATGMGLHLLPRVKFEHIRLTSFSKMRVDLAAQVGDSLCVNASSILRLT